MWYKVFNNELHLDILSNVKLGNVFFRFRPYTRIGNNVFFSYGIAFLSLLIFPLLPLFSRYLITLRKDNLGGDFCDSILFNVSNRPNPSDYRGLLLSKTSGQRIKFKFNYYSSYILNCVKFFWYFKNRPWFFSSVIHLVEVVALVQFLHKFSFKRVTMYNHYDRWAYILSEIVEQRKGELFVIQHGKFDYSYKPFEKIKRVHFFLGFNVSDIEYYKNEIVIHLLNSELSFPKIKLINKDVSLLSLLVVGHGDISVVKKEVEFIENVLRLDKDIQIYLKPHPAYNNKYLYERVVRLSAKVILIDEKYFFPDVLVLIHSGSTLAEEYSNSSSRVHVLNLINDSSYADFVRVINEV